MRAYELLTIGYEGRSIDEFVDCLKQAFRDWRAKYTTEKVLLEKIEQRWLDIANTAKKDVYFYVGNLKRFRTTFVVLRVFYPKL
jgi:hypothetical protein